MKKLSNDPKHVTREMLAGFVAINRSAYIGERALGSPDPGAEAVAVWLRGIAGVR